MKVGVERSRVKVSFWLKLLRLSEHEYENARY
jgi:hypothetical protein